LPREGQRKDAFLHAKRETLLDKSSREQGKDIPLLEKEYALEPKQSGSGKKYLAGR